MDAELAAAAAPQAGIRAWEGRVAAMAVAMAAAALEAMAVAAMAAVAWEAVQQFPIGAMGNYRSLRHVHTSQAIVDQSVGRSCASESRGKHVSNFPNGAMGTFERERAHT